MTETPVTRKTTKPAAATAALFELPKFELPKFEFPKFDLPKMDVPEGMREFAEALADYNRAALEASRTNLNAAFDWALALAKATTFNEVVELSTTHMRTRFEAMGEQGKELAALAQKAANDTAEPIKSGLTEAFKNVA
jgi:Phasin protein